MRRFFAAAEGRPDNTGLEMAKELMGAKIPMMLILDAGVANMMGQIDMVLLGAEGVVESGGVINHIGTYQTALVARSMNKPVYVAAESYKVLVFFSCVIRNSRMRGCFGLRSYVCSLIRIHAYVECHCP